MFTLNSANVHHRVLRISMINILNFLLIALIIAQLYSILFSINKNSLQPTTYIHKLSNIATVL